MKKEKWIMVGAIVVLAILNRIPLLTMHFLDVDEALFATFARLWQHGGIPYVQAVETKALGIYYFYAFASWLSGSLPDINMIAVHVLTIVWTLLTAWVLARITMRFSTERAGLWAALLFVLFTTFHTPKIISSNMEPVLLLPMCLAFDMVLRARIGRLHCLLSGIFLASAILCKYQAGIVIPVIIAYFFWRRDTWKVALGHTLYFGIGGLIPLMAMVWHLDQLGAVPDFLFWNFKGSMTYIAAGAASIPLWRKTLTHILPYIACTLLIWVLTAARAVDVVKRGLGTLVRAQPMEASIWLWLLLSFIPVSLGKRFYGHYFLLLIPQLCILSAAQISTWAPALWRRRRKWVLAGILVPMILTGTLRHSMQTFYPLVSEEYINDYISYGEFIKARTRPEDRILVWGYNPAVYYFSERLPAARFLWSDLLVGRIFGMPSQTEKVFENRENPQMWMYFFHDLAENRPAYIIDMAPTGLHNYQKFPMANYPVLMRYVTENYVEEAPFQKARVFRRKDIAGRPDSQTMSTPHAGSS